MPSLGNKLTTYSRGCWLVHIALFPFKALNTYKVQLSWFTSNWNWHHLLWKCNFSFQPLVSFQAVKLFCSVSEWEDPSGECSLRLSLCHTAVGQMPNLFLTGTNSKWIWQQSLESKKVREYWTLTTALLSNCEEINGAHQSNNLSGSSHNTHMDVRRKMEEDRNTNHP